MGGGDYHGSLIAFSFLTIFSFSMIIFIISKVILKNYIFSLSCVNIILCCILINPIFVKNSIIQDFDIYKAIISTLNPGNSARFIRGFIVPISILAILFLFKKNILNINLTNNKLILSNNILIGIISGICFLWSNDYGISSCVCIIVMYIIYLISKKQTVFLFFKNTFITIFTSIISILIFAEVFTLGYASSWIEKTFGTGSYQGWYYQSKSFYLYDIDFSYIIVIQLLICIIYILLLYKKGFYYKYIKRFGVLAFANMVSFCAVNEYRLLSGGDSREVALVILFFSILFEIINYISINIYFIKKIFFSLSLFICIPWLLSNIKNEIIFNFYKNKDGIYIEELGGNMTSLAYDIIYAKKFIGNNKIFSSYASAQEVICNTFQPSGIDYNIHVLGDKQRLDYINVFKNNKFMYVITILEDYSPWQLWNERANWFFYRILYKNWHPVYKNTYELIWKKNENNLINSIQLKQNIHIKKINNNTTKIYIKTDKFINGIADIYIDYYVNKNESFKSNFLIRYLLKVSNTGIINNKYRFYESNYLRTRSKEYIPMKIIDGYGELTLTSCPEESTNLNINKVDCNEILTVSYDKIHLNVANLSDTNWEKGISISDNKKLLFIYSDDIIKKIKKSKIIICNNINYKILRYDIYGNWIHIDVDKNASNCKFPAYIVFQ